MRRDYFTVDVATESTGEQQPTVTIEYDGPDGEFGDRLTDDAGAPLSERQVDVSFRLLGTEVAEDTARGVLALSNRVTGEYILECNTEVEDVMSLVDAARADEAGTDDGERYVLTVLLNDREALRHETSTFLVYGPEGDLLRQRSLIPSNVEL